MRRNEFPFGLLSAFCDEAKPRQVVEEVRASGITLAKIKDAKMGGKTLALVLSPFKERNLALSPCENPDVLKAVFNLLYQLAAAKDGKCAPVQFIVCNASSRASKDPDIRKDFERNFGEQFVFRAESTAELPSTEPRPATDAEIDGVLDWVEALCSIANKKEYVERARAGESAWIDAKLRPKFAELDPENRYHRVVPSLDLEEEYLRRDWINELRTYFKTTDSHRLHFFCLFSAMAHFVAHQSRQSSDKPFYDLLNSARYLLEEFYQFMSARKSNRELDYLYGARIPQFLRHFLDTPNPKKPRDYVLMPLVRELDVSVTATEQDVKQYRGRSSTTVVLATDQLPWEKMRVELQAGPVNVDDLSRVRLPEDIVRRGMRHIASQQAFSVGDTVYYPAVCGAGFLTTLVLPEGDWVLCALSNDENGKKKLLWNANEYRKSHPITPPTSGRAASPPRFEARGEQGKSAPVHQHQGVSPPALDLPPAAAGSEESRRPSSPRSSWCALMPGQRDGAVSLQDAAEQDVDHSQRYTSSASTTPELH